MWIWALLVCLPRARRYRNLTDWKYADDREHITVEYRDKYGGKPKAVADRVPWWQSGRDTHSGWKTHLGWHYWDGDRDHDERMYRDSKKYKYRPASYRYG